MNKSPSQPFKISSLRNWIILAAAAGGGYFIYKKWIAPAERLDKAATGAPAAKPKLSQPVAPAPDLNGPKVRKGVLVSTRSTICIATKEPGMVYQNVIKTDAQGYQSFKPTVNGVFTRRLLCIGKNRWAEIKPA